MSDLGTPAAKGSVTECSRRLRLLTYNVQVGIGGTRPHHYLTKSWKNLLPARRRFENLSRIAGVLRDYDIVGLQELDAGSHRTGQVNLTAFLAEQAHFPFWHHQINRDLGRFAQHGNGLLSRFRPMAVEEYQLPGRIPGRGALLSRFGNGDDALVVMMVHLALGQSTRLQQLEFISELVNSYRHVVLMGDLNCDPFSPEMALLFRRTGLVTPAEELKTFPSWRPQRSIDHILVTPELAVRHCHVISEVHSDHLPLAMEVELPDPVARALAV